MWAFRCACEIRDRPSNSAARPGRENGKNMFVVNAYLQRLATGSKALGCSARGRLIAEIASALCSKFRALKEGGEDSISQCSRDALVVARNAGPVSLHFILFDAISKVHINDCYEPTRRNPCGILLFITRELIPRILGRQCSSKSVALKTALLGGPGYIIKSIGRRASFTLGSRQGDFCRWPIATLCGVSSCRCPQTGRMKVWRRNRQWVLLRLAGLEV